MGKLAILSALKIELEHFWKSMIDYKSEYWGQHEIRLGHVGLHDIVSFSTGVGKVRAAAATQYVIDNYQPFAIIYIGAAGILNPSLAPGQVVIGEKIIEHDFDKSALASNNHDGFALLETDFGLHKTILKASKGVLGVNRIKSGTILTGDQVIADTEKRKQLMSTYDGDCVEMEGAAVAIVCNQNQMPFVIVRVLSDYADKNARTQYKKMEQSAGQTHLMSEQVS